MPDITEANPLTAATPAASAATERRASGGELVPNRAALKGPRLNSADSGLVTVTGSMPDGTLITANTYNVSASDHLTHLKPMLCVDNGFISGGGVIEELKGAHLVLTEDTSEEKDISVREQPRSWAETVTMPVLPIRCKNTSAELHKMKFGSGGRGKCIKHGGQWFTPSEFEAYCGRASSKDWKRSIRFGGRSIQALIDQGILTPHAASCTCGACCDGDDDNRSTLGPIRLFTPYKKRRRKLAENEDQNTKVKRDLSFGDCDDVEIINQSNSNSQSKEAWQSLADGLDSNTNQYLLTDTPDGSSDPTDIAGHDMTGVLKRLDDISSTLIRLGSELKQCVEAVNIINERQIPRLEPEQSSALLEASVDADSNDVPLHTVDASDPKKCANCNREASAECSLCRRTPYCSTYCQKKDWASHQIECLRSVPSIQADQQHQSIMLIMDSQTNEVYTLSWSRDDSTECKPVETSGKIGTPANFLTYKRTPVSMWDTKATRDNFTIVLVMGLDRVVTVGLYCVPNSTQKLELLVPCIVEALTSLAKCLIVCVLVGLMNPRVMTAALSLTAGRGSALIGNMSFGYLVIINCVIPILSFPFHCCSSGYLLLAKTG